MAQKQRLTQRGDKIRIMHRDSMHGLPVGMEIIVDQVVDIHNAVVYGPWWIMPADYEVIEQVASKHEDTPNAASFAATYAKLNGAMTKATKMLGDAIRHAAKVDQAKVEAKMLGIDWADVTDRAAATGLGIFGAYQSVKADVIHVEDKRLVPVATLPEIASDLLATVEMLRLEMRKVRPDKGYADKLVCQAVTAAIAVSGLAARQYEIMKERGL